MGKKKGKSKKPEGPPDTYMEADPEEAAVEASSSVSEVPESAMGKKMASAGGCIFWFFVFSCVFS